MRNIIYLKLFLLAAIAPIGLAHAKNLPQGCFTGALDDGGFSTIQIKRIERKSFAVAEQTNIDFGFPNADGKVAYSVKLVPSKKFHRGTQAKKEQVSTSSFVTSRVSLRKLSSDGIRYHRFLKDGLATQEPGDPKPVVRASKGTLTRTADEVCAALFDVDS